MSLDNGNYRSLLQGTRKAKHWKCQWPKCPYYASHIIRRGMKRHNPERYVCKKHREKFISARTEILERLDWQPARFDYFS